MSLWKSKRRYEANRRFGSKADEAILAITVLKNDDIGGNLIEDEDAFCEKLGEGKEVLRDLRDALKHPEQADDYQVVIAEELRSDWGKIESDAVERLELYLAHLERASNELEYFENLHDVRRTFERIEDFTSQTAERNADRFRGRRVDYLG